MALRENFLSMPFIIQLLNISNTIFQQNLKQKF